MIELELLRNISIGVFWGGIFFVFGMYTIGKILSAISEFGHDIGHDMDHDVGHEIEHEIEHEIDHDIDHDIEHEVGHSLEIEKELDLHHDVHVEVEKDVHFDSQHHAVEHDVEHDVEHSFEHEIDHDIEHDYDLHVDTDFEAVSVEPVPETHFYDVDRGTPISITIGTILIVFGYLGWLLYNDVYMIDLSMRILGQLLGTFSTVAIVRYTLSKFFFDTGYLFYPRDMINMQVIAMTTITGDFGEVRGSTPMGNRRMYARPTNPATVYPRDTILYVITADDRYLYVSHKAALMVYSRMDAERELALVMESYTKEGEQKTFFRIMLGSVCAYCGQANEEGQFRCSYCNGSLKVFVKYKHSV
jgi:hypothetical protein